MDIYISGKTGEIINLGNKIAKGGEGTIFDVTNPGNSLCFKLYLEKLRTEEREKKLKYMCANAPAELSHKRFLLCWPLDVIYCNGEFVGYIMEKAFIESQAPYHLCLPEIPEKLGSVWSARFKRGTTEGDINRLKLCLNIAAAVARIHQSHKYVLVDLKPQNLLVTTDGKVSLIDLDSLQISDGKSIFFKAPVSTPEYSPPEAKAILNSGKPIPESWDSFSLGVLIYEILCGIHPFAATADAPYHEVNTISEKIEKQLSPLTCDKKVFKIIPPPHQVFDLHSDNLKNLLRQIFAGTFNNGTTRPNVELIGKTLYDEIGYYRNYEEKIECQKNVQLISELKKEKQDLINREKWLNERWDESKKEIEYLKVTSKKGVNKGVVTFLIIALIILVIAFISTYQNQEDSLSSLRIRNSDLTEQLSGLEKQKETINDLQSELGIIQEKFPPFVVKKIEFRSTDYYDNLKIDYGYSLYRSDCYYINPRIKYYAAKSGSYDIYIKIYTPDGSMKTGSSSPSGYCTMNKSVSIYKGNNSIELSGWGNNSGNSYSYGTYRYEIWINGEIIGSQDFYISNY